MAATAKWLMTRDNRAATFVALGNQFEQNAGLSLILSWVTEIQDETVECVELGHQCRPRQIASRGLLALSDVGYAGEEHALTSFDQPIPDGSATWASMDKFLTLPTNR